MVAWSTGATQMNCSRFVNVARASTGRVQPPGGVVSADCPATTPGVDFRLQGGSRNAALPASRLERAGFTGYRPCRPISLFSKMAASQMQALYNVNMATFSKSEIKKGLKRLGQLAKENGFSIRLTKNMIGSTMAQKGIWSA
jgi:hypothetical protein